MPLAVVFDALDLPHDADDAQIAARLREMGGLTGASAVPALWLRLLDWFTYDIHARPMDKLSDLGEMANSVALWSIKRGDVRWTAEAWMAELNVADATEADEWIRGFVIDTLGPRLSRAGLLRAQPYEDP